MKYNDESSSLLLSLSPIQNWQKDGNILHTFLSLSFSLSGKSEYKQTFYYYYIS